jgi:hypothetical protein
MSGDWQTLRLAIVKTEGAAEIMEAEGTLVMLEQGRSQQAQPAQPKPRPKSGFYGVAAGGRRWVAQLLAVL